MTNEEKIAAKAAEVANYERILANYYGRWYDMGKRRLEELRNELQQLKDLPL
jgi:hypothetical protein